MNFIKFTCLTFAAMFILCSGSQKPETKKLSIVPQPSEVSRQSGFFTVNDRTTLVLSEDDRLLPIVDLINLRFKNAAGFELDIAQKKATDNFIFIELDEGAQMGREEYVLNATPHEITVIASSEQGIFYGMMTLLQLLPPEIESSSLVDDIEWYIPCVEIKDKPRFVWRGMHLDVCRHFVSVDFIKKQLDVMALYKMNTFHWHLTEDQAWRVEIKKYPLLTELGSKRFEGEGYEYGGFYTQEDIKEVVAYAQERFINVVPEIELPGHALGALKGYPQFSCTGGPFEVRNVWGVEADVYCAGKEETFAFLEDIIEEIVALFPSEYFHIGGDECPKKRWEKCPRCQKRMKAEGLKDEHELQSYFIKRIGKVLLSHDKKMIGWDEILEGGLAPSAAVMSWRGEKGGIEAAEQGHDVVMTPGNWCYLDHFQGSNKVEPVAIGGYTTLEESYSYDPIPKELDDEKENHILGTQGNVWSEYMYTPELFEYRIYPRIIALAEVGWTEKANKDFNHFLERMDNQFVRLDKHNINYHIPLPEGPVNIMAFLDTVILEFTTSRPVKMVYTLDGTLPDQNSTIYSKPLVFTDNQIVNIRSVLNSGKMSSVRKIKVEKQILIKASNVVANTSGLKLKTAIGNFISVEDLDKVVQWDESLLEKEALDDWLKRKVSSDLDEPFAAILFGYVTIPSAGIYEFQTNVDQFYIGNRLLVDNNKEVKRFSRNNATIALEKGKHPVAIYYLNNIIGGWPQTWNGAVVEFKKEGADKFVQISSQMYSF